MVEQQYVAEYGPMPLAGVTVVDASTLFAGPYAAQLLADFGAAVIKVEHPVGDPLPRFGRFHEGVPLLWKVLNRNKKCVVLDLKRSEDKQRFLAVLRDADVLIENFRPGTLERWGLGPMPLSLV